MLVLAVADLSVSNVDPMASEPLDDLSPFGRLDKNCWDVLGYRDVIPWRLTGLNVYYKLLCQMSLIFRRDRMEEEIYCLICWCS